MTIAEITALLTADAEQKFGKARAAALQSEIELLAQDLVKLYGCALEFDDEA